MQWITLLGRGGWGGGAGLNNKSASHFLPLSQARMHSLMKQVTKRCMRERLAKTASQASTHSLTQPSRRFLSVFAPNLVSFLFVFHMLVSFLVVLFWRVEERGRVPFLRREGPWWRGEEELTEPSSCRCSLRQPTASYRYCRSSCPHTHAGHTGVCLFHCLTSS